MKMKNTISRFYCILILLCFLLVVFFLDKILYFFPLYQLEKAIRHATQYSRTFIFMMKISSLLAIAFASFGFGFIKQFNCKLAGLSASLYLVLDWLSFLHSVLFVMHLNLQENVVIYNSSIYILAAVIAYIIGFAFCSFSKKLKRTRQNKILVESSSASF